MGSQLSHLFKVPRLVPLFEVEWITRPGEYNYYKIFARCCDNAVTHIAIEDKFAIEEPWQAKNFKKFCKAVADMCKNLRVVELRAPPCDDEDLKKLADDLQEECNIKLKFTKLSQHPRCIRFINGWTVVADRGLNIYGAASDEDCPSYPLTYFMFCGPGTDVPEYKEERTPSICRPPTTRTPCFSWKDSAHVARFTKCPFYHPKKECSNFRNCPNEAWKCVDAHPFCQVHTDGKVLPCVCPEGARNTKFNHYFKNN